VEVGELGWIRTPVAVKCDYLGMRGSLVPLPQGTLCNYAHGKSVGKRTFRFQNPLLL